MNRFGKYINRHGVVVRRVKSLYFEITQECFNNYIDITNSYQFKPIDIGYQSTTQMTLKPNADNKTYLNCHYKYLYRDQMQCVRENYAWLKLPFYCGAAEKDLTIT